jgi:DNA-binding MarR family transcriptional regulator
MFCAEPFHGNPARNDLQMMESMMPMDYMEVIALAERLHRQFLDVIQLELDRARVRDINNVQAMILHNIGDTEMTVSELMWRGCYLGTNVSYNLKKLTEAGYVDQERSTHDRRVIMIRASRKGAELSATLKAVFGRHVDALSRGNLKTEDIAACGRTLRGLQQFWSRAADSATFGQRALATA